MKLYRSVGSGPLRASSDPGALIYIAYLCNDILTGRLVGGEGGGTLGLPFFRN